MSLRTSATRYARALLDTAIQQSDASRVEAHLATIVGAMQQHPDLARAMTSPGVPASARRGIAEAIAARAGEEAPVAKLVTMLADRGRLELLPHVLEVYRERLLEHRRVVRASLTAAAPLSPEQIEAIGHRLGTLTGREVELGVAVDGAIIGGLVARIGGTVYDGSVRTQLEKMRRQLVEQG